MPLDQQTVVRPANYFDVGYSVFTTRLALQAVSTALDRLAANSSIDISKEIAEIDDAVKGLYEEFVRLTGWTQA